MRKKKMFFTHQYLNILNAVDGVRTFYMLAVT